MTYKHCLTLNCCAKSFGLFSFSLFPQRGSIIYFYLLVAVSILLLAGCAGVTTISVGDEKGQTSDDDARGIRHYGYKVPFILITPRVGGGVDSQVIYLADTNNRFSSRPYAFIAENKTSLNFTNGVLGNSEITVDETKAPQVALDILKSLAEVAAKAFFPLSTEPDKSISSSFELPMPVLFRVFVDYTGVLSARGEYGGRSIKFSLSNAYTSNMPSSLIEGTK